MEALLEIVKERNDQKLEAGKNLKKYILIQNYIPILFL